MSKNYGIENASLELSKSDFSQVRLARKKAQRLKLYFQ